MCKYAPYFFISRATSLRQTSVPWFVKIFALFICWISYLYIWSYVPDIFCLYHCYVSILILLPIFVHRHDIISRICHISCLQSFLEFLIWFSVFNICPVWRGGRVLTTVAYNWNPWTRCLPKRIMHGFICRFNIIPFNSFITVLIYEILLI